MSLNSGKEDEGRNGMPDFLDEFRGCRASPAVAGHEASWADCGSAKRSGHLDSGVNKL